MMLMRLIISILMSQFFGKQTKSLGDMVEQDLVPSLTGEAVAGPTAGQAPAPSPAPAPAPDGAGRRLADAASPNLATQEAP